LAAYPFSRPSTPFVLAVISFKVTVNGCSIVYGTRQT
jgi:hypothetical protein